MSRSVAGSGASSGVGGGEGHLSPQRRGMKRQQYTQLFRQPRQQRILEPKPVCELCPQGLHNQCEDIKKGTQKCECYCGLGREPGMAMEEMEETTLMVPPLLLLTRVVAALTRSQSLTRSPGSPRPMVERVVTSTGVQKNP